MPQELIEKYNERHHTNIDAVGMMGAVSTILVAYKDAEKRDEMLKQYLMESYSEMAAKYQYDKMSRQIRGENTEGYTAAPQELLGEYIGIFTVVVNTVSEQRLEDAKQAEIEAKEATKKAFDAAEEARNAFNDSLEGDRARSRDLKAEFEKLEQKYKAAQANEKNVFTFEKYTPTMPYFTLGSHDVESLMANQQAGFTYRDFRRHQMKTLGVRNSVFASELPSTNQNLGFGDLNPEMQQKIMETWVTKQLMQEELDSRSWWSKNIWNRREAKAMREYIGRANVVLSGANQYGDQERFENMLNSLLSKGYEKLDDNTVGRKMRSFAADFVPNDKPLRELADKKERLAEEQRIREQNAKEEEERKKAERAQKKSDDKKLADEKAKQREEQKALWESKKAAFKPTIDEINVKNKANEEALNGQSLYQRLQDPKFMPSFNPSRHLDEVDAVNKTASILKKQNATVALEVVKKNVDKLKLMHQFIKMVNTQDADAQAFINKANEVYEGCKSIETEQDKIAANPAYAKVENVEELIAAAEREKEKEKRQAAKGGNNEPQKESVQINPEQIDGVQPNEVSPVHEENVVSKDPVVKNNP